MPHSPRLRRPLVSHLVVALGLGSLVACASYAPSRIRAGDLAEPTGAATRYLPVDPASASWDWVEGDATWYGHPYHGRRTANGETFNMYAYTAAHRHLPFGTVVRVWLGGSEASVVVRINDRGPFGAGRIIDLSWAAAMGLGIVERGVAPVELEVLQWGDGAIYER
jgi:rare lipoprotein A